MRIIVYTACFFTAILFFGSCNKTSLYEQKAKTLDSLDGAVNSIVKELQSADTITLQKAIVRYSWYKEFIRQNVSDTLSRKEADNLQHFLISGKNLENFSLNRKTVLARALLINTQLAKLGEDLKKKSVSTEQLSAYVIYEKAEAAKAIESGYQQQKLFHSGLEEFKNSLKGVELLIRSRNKGELPTIVNDTVSL